jgi:hypothetical protein
MVDEGAHFMPYQAPQQFAALVNEFIDRKVKF